jgi:hypothetical protein
MDLIKNIVTPENNDSIFPTLSLKERLIGFAICFVVGTFLQILSTASFLMIMTGKIKKFAILYTFGNIVSLMG